jgi:asparagine synthase (glutamine-hydrolysing)
MCGFFVATKKKIFNKKLALESANFLSHRGPDDMSVFENNDIYIVFYRLSIRDLSANGRQPMKSHSGRFVIVFNGEIYNADYLRNKLDKSVLKGNSDTEILVNLYEKYGESIIHSIKGMFSFVIYDIKNKVFFIVRDRFGIKPLYYIQDNEYFLISSEIKPLLFYTKKNNFDDLAFGDFFFKGFMDHDEKTFFKHVKSFEPSTYKIITRNKVKTVNYWNLNKEINQIDSNQNIINKIKNLFDNSIEEHLCADTKIGSFLSGGNDSSSITVHSSKKLKYKMDTFTYYFSDSSKNNYSELEYAQDVAKRNNVFNSYTAVNPDYILNNFNQMLKNLESPFTSIRTFGVKKLYEEVKKKKIKVILEGYGGDEMFAGYNYNYFPYYIGSNLNIKKNALLDKIFSIKHIKKFGVEKIINFLHCISSQGNFTSDGTPYLFFDLFNEDFVNEYLKKINVTHLPDKMTLLQKSQYFDTKFIHLPRTLKYVDRLSMASSVEARVPFLDHEFFKFCFNIRDNLKIKNFKHRWIWDKSFKIKNFNTEKRTIVDPQRAWFKDFLSNLLKEELETSNKSTLEMFNKKNILLYLKNYNKNISSTSFNLMQILTAVKFLKIYKNNNFTNY